MEYEGEVIPIVVGALGTVPKNFEKRLEESLEIRGRIETIQNTALLQSATILRRDLRRFVVIQPPVKYHQLTLM